MFDITDVRPVVQLLIHDHPNTRNPRNEMFECLYDDGHGRKCLIGAVLNELGLPIPDRVASIFDVVLDDPDLYPFTDKAIRYMAIIQDTADQADDDSHVGAINTSIQWGSIDEAKIYRETFQ